MLALSMNKKREFKIFLRILVKTILAAGLMAILTSCGTSPGYNYTISGTVSGMAGSGLVLQDNGGDDRTITANGAFSFVTALTSGTVYSITVKTQPTNPSQTCVVSNGSGAINGSPVTNVAVSCTMNSGPVTVDPMGLFAYVSNANTSNISGYTIDQTSSSTPGQLTLVGTFGAGTNPTQVTVDPSGKFAYAANTGSNNISVYTINTDGSLSASSTTPTVTAGTSPVSVTIYPYTSGTFASSGEFAYVPNMTDNTISVYTINTDGSLTASLTTPTVTAGSWPIAIAVYADPNNKFASAYVANMGGGTISVYTINTDGSLTASPTTPTVTAGTYPVSVTTYTNSSGASFAYVPNIGSSDISVYAISSTDGSLSPNPGTTVTAGTYPASVTIYTNSSGASFAYVSNMGSSNISVYAISSTDGSLSPNPGTTVTTGTYPNPVTIYTNSSGTFAYVSDKNDGIIWVYSIGTSGALSNIQQMASGGTSLTTVTIDPKGPYAYVSDSSFGTVYGFIINSDGSLTANP